MSGDIGLEQPIIFYHKRMTEAKKIVLEQKGIKLAYKTFGKPLDLEEEE